MSMSITIEIDLKMLAQVINLGLKMISRKLLLIFISFFLVTSINAANLPINDITYPIPIFWTIENHGSNLQVINNQLVAVWFHGGERTAEFSTIFGTNSTLDNFAWTLPITLADNGNAGKVPYFPDVNPAIYYNQNTKKLFLFWMKINNQHWESAEVRLRIGLVPNNFSNINQINWENEISGTLLLPQYDQTKFTQTVTTYLQNAWPLSQGHFDPATSMKNAPSFGQCQVTSQSFNITQAEKQQIYQKLITEISQFNNQYYSQLKEKLQRHQSTNQLSLKEVNNFKSLAVHLKSINNSANGGIDSILDVIYYIYDEYNIIKMQTTVFDKSNKDYYQRGWETRTTPVSINLPNSHQRLLLPLYSDGLNFSLVIYSDDDGKTWHYANTPIASRAGIQPSIVQLPNGDLIAFMRNNAGVINLNRVLMSRSCDNGLSWSPAVPVMASGLTNESASLSATLLNKGQYASDPAVLLVFNPDQKRQILNAAIATVKSDDTLNWQKPITLESSTVNNTTFEYPSAIQSNTGVVAISFSHRYLSKTECGDSLCQKIGVIKTSF